MNEERKPVWPWGVAVIFILPLLYTVAFGPACWISSHVTILVPAVEIVYSPVLFAWGEWFAGTPVSDFLHWYSQLGAPDNWWWTGANEWKAGY